MYLDSVTRVILTARMFSHASLSFVCRTIINGGRRCGVLPWALWRVALAPRGELHVCELQYVLVLRSHVLPDSMVSNLALLPIFPLYLVSSGRDYTGLDNLPEADMHSFI